MISRVKGFGIYLFVSFSIIYLYIALSQFWVSIGGTSWGPVKLEYPFIFAILAIFYFNIRDKFIKYMVPPFPIIAFYIIFDVFYKFLERPLRISDIKNFPTIFDFQPLMALATIVTGLLILFSLGLLIKKAFEEYSAREFISQISFKAFSLIILMLFLSSDLFVHYHDKVYYFLDWSPTRSIRKNGRISSFIFFSNREKRNFELLKIYKTKDIDIKKSLYPGNVAFPHNIHVVVLESFFDPRTLPNINFNRNPVAEELLPYLNNGGQFSKVISPTYGGRTAQAEFELLTGIKAYGIIESMEFNIMNGREINGFLYALKENGYQAIATIATDSNYYNSKNAYKSLGFNYITFTDKQHPLVKKAKREGDKYIFDGDFLDYHFEIIKEYLDKKKCLFSYAIGMYGHYPFDRNIEKRPDIIHISPYESHIHRAVNQFYYRTRAIANFIKNLLAIDPNSIIYITGDHLPPIVGSEIPERDRFLNIAILIYNGKVVDVSGKRYYQIPWLLWDTLSGKVTYRENLDMEQIYFKALGESL